MKYLTSLIFMWTLVAFGAVAPILPNSFTTNNQAAADAAVKSAALLGGITTNFVGTNGFTYLFTNGLLAGKIVPQPIIGSFSATLTGTLEATVSWSGVANSDYVYISRSDDGGNNYGSETQKGVGQTFVDGTLSFNSTYWYRARGWSSLAGYGSYATAQSVTTGSAPTAGTTLIVTGSDVSAANGTFVLDESVTSENPIFGSVTKLWTNSASGSFIGKTGNYHLYMWPVEGTTANAFYETYGDGSHTGDPDNADPVAASNNGWWNIGSAGATTMITVANQ